MAWKPSLTWSPEPSAVAHMPPPSQLQKTFLPSSDWLVPDALPTVPECMVQFPGKSVAYEPVFDTKTAVNNGIAVKAAIRPFFIVITI